MRGPGMRLKYDVRRQWKCPKCGLERLVAATATTVRCQCETPGPLMQLLESKRYARAEPAPLPPYFEMEEIPASEEVAAEPVLAPEPGAVPVPAAELKTETASLPAPVSVITRLEIMTTEPTAKPEQAGPPTLHADDRPAVEESPPKGNEHGVL